MSIESPKSDKDKRRWNRGLNRSAVDFFRHADKLRTLTSSIKRSASGGGPPLAFAQALNRDLETKQALRLFAERRTINRRTAVRHLRRARRDAHGGLTTIRRIQRL